MPIHDIASLFIDTPLDKTIYICLNESFDKKTMFQILNEPLLRKFCGLLRKSDFSFSIKISINS